jgi:hypothetical protein
MVGAMLGSLPGTLNAAFPKVKHACALGKRERLSGSRAIAVDAEGAAPYVAYLTDTHDENACGKIAAAQRTTLE